MIETDAVAEGIESVVGAAGGPGDDLRGEVAVGIENVPEHIPRRCDPPQRRRDRVRNAAAVDRTDPQIPRGGGPSPVERVNPRRIARRDLGSARGGFPPRVGIELRHHRRLVRGVTETEEVPELVDQNHPEIDDARSPEGHPLGAHRGRGHRRRFRRPTELEVEVNEPLPRPGGIGRVGESPISGEEGRTPFVIATAPTDADVGGTDLVLLRGDLLEGDHAGAGPLFRREADRLADGGLFERCVRRVVGPAEMGGFASSPHGERRREAVIVGEAREGAIADRPEHTVEGAGGGGRLGSLRSGLPAATAGEKSEPEKRREQRCP